MKSFIFLPSLVSELAGGGGGGGCQNDPINLNVTKNTLVF